MAKKRKRKPGGGRSSRPSRGTAAPAATGPSGRTVRSEAVRRQASLDRDETRRRRSRRLAVAGGFVLALVLLVVLEVYLHRLNGTERQLLDQAPDAAAAAGCTSVQTVAPYPKGLDRVHIGSPQARVMPPLSTYPSTPPASGPHAPAPLGAGVYSNPPAIGMTIHSLEHAAVIVWYDPTTADPAELDRIRSFFRQGDERNHVIVAPYDYPDQGPAGQLPSGRQMALVAWHRLQYCSQPNLPVAYAFVHQLRFNLYQWGA